MLLYLYVHRFRIEFIFSDESKMLLRKSVLRVGEGLLNGNRVQNGVGQFNRIFHKYPLSLGYRHKENNPSLLVNSAACLNVNRTLNLQGFNPNALSVRSQGTLPAKIVESCPAGLQHYLRLARLDKPVGKLS